MRVNIWKASTLVLTVALTTVLGAQLAGVANAEPQPHMRAALELLQQADKQLEKATADKGGHRVNARGHLAKAIEEVKAGIEFDNKHPRDDKK
jgi:hypothetical protein